MSPSPLTHSEFLSSTAYVFSQTFVKLSFPVVLRIRNLLIDFNDRLYSRTEIHLLRTVSQSETIFILSYFLYVRI